MIKSCGGCVYWIKWTNDKWGRGICEAHDWTCKSDTKACANYNAIPYKYKKKYKSNVQELKHGQG